MLSAFSWMFTFKALKSAYRNVKERQKTKDLLQLRIMAEIKKSKLREDFHFSSQTRIVI